MKKLIFALSLMLVMLACSNNEQVEPVKEFDLSQIERVDPSVVINSINEYIANNDLDKSALNSLNKAKEELAGMAFSRGDSEVICNNNAGWIVIDNDTGRMTLYSYGSSPTGVRANPCDMDCAQSHCFGEDW